MPAEIVGEILDQNGNPHAVKWDVATGEVWVSATDNQEGGWLKVDGTATSADFAVDMAGAHLLANPM